MSTRLLAFGILMVATGVHAADQPFGLLDIPLGASYGRLAHELDFRDIGAALAAQTAGKTDLGKRGYGCMKREDPFADVGCVSHDEKLEGTATREIRLHFLHGRLQQFSLSAEQQHYDAVIAYLRRRYGEPQQVAASSPGAEPSLKWQSESGQIAAYRGKDLVFVNFELVTYPDAVKRKREGGSLECS